MTGRALVNPKAAEHLARICGMFGSAHDGEALNAARMADRFVKQLGLRWCDVIFFAPEWQMMARICRDSSYELSAREFDFINSISRSRRMPTDKQLAWLEAIYNRLAADGSGE